MPALPSTTSIPYTDRAAGFLNSSTAVSIAQGLYDTLTPRDSSSHVLVEDGGIRDGRGLHGRRIDTTALFNRSQKYQIQVIAAVAASVSVLVTMVTLYWFCRMKKRFRHMLVLSLILGDLIRAFWYLVFVLVSLTRGTVSTRSAFCQASGWWIQFGTEMIDLSVLFIAINGAIYIYKPHGSDGLYKYRYYVYACTFLVPLVMASLAFIQTGAAYMSQGAFCSLPIRPFWYRLALAWVPRYIITIVILSLTVAMYVHVQRAIKAVEHAKTRKMSMFRPWEAIPSKKLSLRSMEPAHLPEDATKPNSSAGDSMSDAAGDHPGLSPSRRASTVTTFVNTTSSTLPPADAPDMDQLRNPGQPGNVSPKHGGPEQRASVATSLSVDGTLPPVGQDGLEDGDTAARRQSKQRLYMLRQLRLTFVYPIIYLAMWFVPFVLHCFQYHDAYAQRPPIVLVALAVFCYTFMCTVDCLVFNLREKPWRHIPANDRRTLAGSFAFWRRRPRSPDATPSPASLRLDLAGLRRESAVSARPPSHPLTPVSGTFRFHTTSDRQKLAAEQARERLAGEMADRRSQALSAAQLKAGPGAPSREWFERRESTWGLTRTESDRDVEGPG